eukprot:1083597-Prymnesium_polylepis.2
MRRARTAVCAAPTGPPHLTPDPSMQQKVQQPSEVSSTNQAYLAIDRYSFTVNTASFTVSFMLHAAPFGIRSHLRFTTLSHTRVAAVLASVHNPRLRDFCAGLVRFLFADAVARAQKLLVHGARGNGVEQPVQQRGEGKRDKPGHAVDYSGHRPCFASRQRADETRHAWCARCGDCNECPPVKVCAE